MDTQYRKNLKAVLTASKDYTDNSIEKLKWELGTYDLSVETINGTTMLLPTPANTIQATMDKIYGASEVGTNLCNEANIQVGLYNADGTYEANVKHRTSDLIEVKEGETYTAKLIMGGSSYSLVWTFWDSDERIVGEDYQHSTVTISSGIKYVRIRNFAAQDLTNKSVGQFHFMLNEGSTALPYQAYIGFIGIHNLELSGLKVEGANLSPLDKVRNNQFFASLGAGTYTFSCKTESTGGGINLRDGGVASSNPVVINISVSSTNPSGTFTLTKRTDLYFNAYGNAWTNYDIMLNRGSTALAYVPYIAPTTLPIDLSSILYNGSPLFDGNSLKAVGTAKDYITPYKAHKEVKNVDLSTLNFEKIGTGNNTRFTVTLSDVELPADNDTIIETKITSFNWVQNSANGTWDNKSGYSINISGVLAFYTQDYSTAEAFKTAMSGVMLEYPLATPIEVSIDWSSKLLRQTCYSNGSVSLENTNNQDTTSQIDYLIEEVKA